MHDVFLEFLVDEFGIVSNGIKNVDIGAVDYWCDAFVIVFRAFPISPMSPVTMIRRPPVPGSDSDKLWMLATMDAGLMLKLSSINTNSRRPVILPEVVGCGFPPAGRFQSAATSPAVASPMPDVSQLPLNC